MPVRMQSPITDHHPQGVATRKSTRWGAILVGMVALVTASAVAALAGVARPPVPGQQPKDAGPRYVGPTADLTAVANAISMRHKSLTILVTVNPNLTLTNPVAISIAFDATRQTRSYVASTGNRFLYNAPLGSGYPRRVGVAITLTEYKPVVGGVATFSRANPAVGATFTLPSWWVDLDPLFDVSISPLRFTLQTKCERFYEGDADIRFRWTSPEGIGHRKNFDTTKGRVVTITEFAWARQEVSASANLYFPAWFFFEGDSLRYGAYLDSTPTPTTKLLPTTVSGYVGRSLTAGREQSGCVANTAFDITIEVHKYDNL